MGVVDWNDGPAVSRWLSMFEVECMFLDVLLDEGIGVAEKYVRVEVFTDFFKLLEKHVGARKPNLPSFDG